jgi:uroporphyrinogen III methyltransferase / synthase
MVYMGIKNLPIITQSDQIRTRSANSGGGGALGLDPGAALGGRHPGDHHRGGQRRRIKPPALIIIGEVVKLRDTIDWFEKRPLFGKRILVTRTREQASELVAGLEEYGADCLEYSTIRIQPVDCYDALDEELERLDEYHWILFTSLNGVKYFFERLYAKGMDARNLKGPEIAVVGKSTADLLLHYGVHADLIPAVFTGEGLAESLARPGCGGTKYPHSPGPAGAGDSPRNPAWGRGPGDGGAGLSELSGRGRQGVLREELRKGTIDMVTFTSSSTVRNFLALLEDKEPGGVKSLMAGVKVAAIGPITAKTVTDSGLKVDVMPKEHTIAAMIEAIVASHGAVG